MSIVAFYMLAKYIVSPKKIILGGRVMNQKQVFSSVYKYLPEFLNNYVTLPELSDYIV